MIDYKAVILSFELVMFFHIPQKNISAGDGLKCENVEDKVLQPAK